MKGIIRFWVIDIHRVRRRVEDIKQTSRELMLHDITNKETQNLKTAIVDFCNKILTLLDKGKV